MAKDILDREISVGDYVVSYNNIYVVLEVYKTDYAKCILLHPSKTTRAKKIFRSDMCLIPSEDVLAWKLRVGI